MPARPVHIFAYLSLGIILLTMGAACAPSPAEPRTPGRTEVGAALPLHWQSAAHWRHGGKKTPGTLALNGSGVEFRAVKGPILRWRFEEIQTFDLSRYRLTVTGYANRGLRLPGERRFRFDFESVMPPAIAAELAWRVAKPAKNGDPNPQSAAFATLGARHPTREGGTNGVLRFRDAGIDYVTALGGGARSWRWADVQTLALPDPYHFRVGAFREVFEFELKQPMSAELFDRLWNDVYARDLRGVNRKGDAQ